MQSLSYPYLVKWHRFWLLTAQPNSANHQSDLIATELSPIRPRVACLVTMVTVVPGKSPWHKGLVFTPTIGALDSVNSLFISSTLTGGLLLQFPPLYEGCKHDLISLSAKLYSRFQSISLADYITVSGNERCVSTSTLAIFGLKKKNRIAMSLKRPFVQKSDVKQWLTTTT